MVKQAIKDLLILQAEDLRIRELKTRYMSLPRERAALVAPISLDVNNQYVMGRDAFNNLSTTVSVSPSPKSQTYSRLPSGALMTTASSEAVTGVILPPVVAEKAHTNSSCWFS